MSAAAERPFGKRSRASAEVPRSRTGQTRRWRKIAGAMLLSGFAMLVHRALVPKRRMIKATDGAGSGETAFDSGDSGGDGGGD